MAAQFGKRAQFGRSIAPARSSAALRAKEERLGIVACVARQRQPVEICKPRRFELTTSRPKRKVPIGSPELLPNISKNAGGVFEQLARQQSALLFISRSGSKTFPIRRPWAHQAQRGAMSSALC